MSPDFPTPETMTRPDAPASNRTARANRSSNRPPAARTAEASSSATRRPRLISAASSNGTGHRLAEVSLEQTVPEPARLEQHLHDLAHGAVTARRAGDVGRERLDLVH